MKILRILVLLFAVGAGFVAYRLVLENQNAPVAEAEPVAVTRSVLVAVNDIPLGKKLEAGDITWRDWPEGPLSNGVITREGATVTGKDFVGMIARDRIYSGEPIRAERLIRTDKGYMAAILPKGKRAIAVRVEQETSAGGFILPGDKVDVILTRKFSDKNLVSDTILQNIRVLAIDATTAGEQETKNLSPKRTATLELSLDQSEIIVQAQQVGSIALALRSAEDSFDVSEAEQTKRRDTKFMRVNSGRWSTVADDSVF
ncbi:Flp pilus assembly protein CpaB [Roseibium sediminicola]|uniref:Flp pilus assembly protein CpaB n=1 Tax=Roseibium sediminicola TaxID=2933272 RepID=A0ABT0GYH9_9HYPH|nr:Flp pilus assembly protein CpaB [Roseibium sp. CAU 1639]MCK7614496.1 Flp pilus assembly protein CpaB [Roseibium sp. CAU 1639]